MLKILIEESIKPCSEGVLSQPFKLGERVTFKENVIENIKEYARLYSEGDETILKLHKVLVFDKKKFFSVLHFANEKSAYPYGTVVIEIAPNEDIEVRGDILESISEKEDFVLLG